MTDGIIQEVLNNYYDDHFYNKKIGKRFNEVLDELKQELIEKIKKEFYDVVEMNEEYILKTLIGDNNE